MTAVTEHELCTNNTLNIVSPCTLLLLFNIQRDGFPGQYQISPCNRKEVCHGIADVTLTHTDARFTQRPVIA